MWSQAQAYCITCLYLTKQSEFKKMLGPMAMRSFES